MNSPSPAPASTLRWPRKRPASLGLTPPIRRHTSGAANPTPSTRPSGPTPWPTDGPAENSTRKPGRPLWTRNASTSAPTTTSPNCPTRPCRTTSPPMTWATDMAIDFTPPIGVTDTPVHHAVAAGGNIDATARTITALSAALSQAADHERILLRAAAGAGKSYALVRMVREALDHANCTRVAVTAFANKQVFPVASAIGQTLGPERTCLFVSDKRVPDIPTDVLPHVTVATKSREIPTTARVVLGVSHKFGVIGELGRMLTQLAAAGNGERPFDVLFVDEAWQLPLHLYSRVTGYAPIVVGVGDVGQLPPIDPNQNPWRGDPGYNPYRAWPTAYEKDDKTVAVDLPAVWRPTAEQLPLWRAFYSDWDALHCVAAPGDRTIEFPPLPEPAQSVWNSVATGVPTLLEVDGLPDPDAPDIDPPLLGVVEDLLSPLVEAGFTTSQTHSDGTGKPESTLRVDSSAPAGDPLI